MPSYGEEPQPQQQGGCQGYQDDSGATHHDVTFVDAAPDISDELDAVDRERRPYSSRTVDRITRAAARSTIIELIRR